MRVVSAPLFDDHERYQPYLPPALRAHHNLFKGWTYRIYHDHLLDSGPYGKALRKLEKRGLVELVFVTDQVMIEKAMLWRLLPLWDKTIELFVIRDVDMVAGYRERRAEEVWIRSGLPVHSMSDLAEHHNFPSINGMMGFRNPQALELLGSPESLEDLFSRASWSEQVWSSNFRASGRGADSRYRVDPMSTNNQIFLKRYVWPLVRQQTCEHRLSGSTTFSDEVALSYTEVDQFMGEDLGVSKVVREKSDSFIPFIGASKANSNIDLDAITEFYKEFGDPSIERLFAECEK